MAAVLVRRAEYYCERRGRGRFGRRCAGAGAVAVGALWGSGALWGVPGPGSQSWDAAQSESQSAAQSAAQSVAQRRSPE